MGINNITISIARAPVPANTGMAAWNDTLNKVLNEVQDQAGELIESNGNHIE